ncbi:MAG: hypothetical protein ABI355_15495 [Solirubrobacteraceae bacterium]
MSADAIGVENRFDKVVPVVDERQLVVTTGRGRGLALPRQEAADRAEQALGG